MVIASRDDTHTAVTWDASLDTSQRKQRSSFGSNVLGTAGTNILIAALAVITGPLAARLLGPSGRGELAAIQNLYWLVGTMAMLGLAEATLYFTAQDPSSGGRVLASSLTLAFLISPVFFLVAFPFVPTLLSKQSAQIAHFTSWYLAGIFLYAAMALPLFAIRGGSDFLHWNLLRVTPTIGWLLVLIAALLSGRATPIQLALSYLGVLTMVMGPTFFLTRRRVPGPFLPELRRWRPMLKYGVPLSAASIPQMLNLRLDQIMMAALLPASVLGLYVVAVGWSTAVQPLLIAIGTASFPRVAGAASQSERERILAQGTRLAAMCAMCLVVFFTALTPLLLPVLFGKAFIPAVRVALILVFASGIAGLNVVFEEGLRGLGDPPAVFLGEAGGLIVTLGCLLLLLRPLGMVGAACASVAGYSTTAVILVTRIRKRTLLTPVLLLLARQNDVQVALRELWSRAISFSK